MTPAPKKALLTNISPKFSSDLTCESETTQYNQEKKRKQMELVSSVVSNGAVQCSI